MMTVTETDRTNFITFLYFIYRFVEDPSALAIDRQFMWGSAFLITPVLTEDATSVTGYFPPAARWYSYYTVSYLRLIK